MALFAAGFLPGSLYGETLEQRVERLDRMVNELREMVDRQNQKIEQQEETIIDLRHQLETPAQPAGEMEATYGPHIDKHILHERSGLGEQLGNIRVGLGVTGIIQGSVNAEDVSGEDSDQTDGSWSSDLELEAPIGEHGLAFMLIEAGQGDGLTDELATVFHGVNDDAGDSESGLEVTEAWYQHYYNQEFITLTVGKLDLTNYVDTNAVANDETNQFLNSGLVNSIAIDFPEDNGAGVRVAVTPDDMLEFNFGWAESDADWEDVFEDGFGIAEANFRPNLLNREGNYRFYVWWNGSDHAELDGDDDDEDGWGLGLSFDQQLTDDITGFFRAGYADDDVYEVEGTWSIGAQMAGNKWDRENDVVGVALSQALINDDVDPDDPETLLEAYYSIVLNEQLAISPDIQIIHNPAGDDHNDTIVIFGTRAQLIF
jgi:hypothetical protein